MPHLGGLLLIVFCLVSYLVIRPYRNGEQQPAAVSNRALHLNKAVATLRPDPIISDVIYNAVAGRWNITPINPGADRRHET